MFLTCQSLLTVALTLTPIQLGEIQNHRNKPETPLGVVLWQDSTADQTVKQQGLEREKKLRDAITRAGGEFTTGDRGEIVSVRLHGVDRGHPFGIDPTKRGERLQLLSSLSELDDLKRLVVKNAFVTDEAMGQIAKLTHLTHLTVWDFGELSDEGIKNLTAMNQLTYLYINNYMRVSANKLNPGAGIPVGSLTDDCLKHVAQMKNLTDLLVYGVNISDDGLAHLADMRQLTTLHLGMEPNQITDAGTAHLTRLVNLERFGIQDADITDSTVESLVGLTKLRDLVLTTKDDAEYKFTDMSLSKLLGMNRLEDLYVFQTTFSISDLRRLLEAHDFSRFIIGTDEQDTDAIKALVAEFKGDTIRINGVSRPNK